MHGRFACAVKHKSLTAGHVKTEAYIDNQMLLEARFCAKGFQEAAGANSPDPTSQLQSLRALLESVSYRRRGFRFADLARAFLKIETFRV